MTEEQAKKFIAKNKWTFAKTYQANPHEWLSIKATEQIEFKAFVQYIDNHKYPEKFYNSTFYYANVGEYKYWHYTDLINRCKIELKYS